MIDPERFWAQVERRGADECWPWLGRTIGPGYGVVGFTRFDARYQANAETTTTAHRVAYELLIGPIPDETLDHLCRNVACCNPAHLDPCTRAENTRRQRAAQKAAS